MEETNPGHMVIEGVQYVTTAEAAKRLGDDVTTDMIKDWVKRGLLKPAGRYGGRSNIFRLTDVAYAEMRTRTQRHGRTRRAGELQKIAEIGQNLPTDAVVNSAQKPARQPRCSVVKDDGTCNRDEVPDAPFRICRDHLRAAYLHWKDHLCEVYGFDPTQLPGPGRLPGPERAQRAKDTRQPFVYYIRFRDRIKIGHSVDLYLRLASLPYDELLAIEPGALELERMRQRQFGEHRISPKGEWFRVHPDLLAHTGMLVKHYGTAESQMDAIGRPAPPRKVGTA